MSVVHYGEQGNNGWVYLFCSNSFSCSLFKMRVPVLNDVLKVLGVIDLKG